jgi:hypothetical protein
LSVTDFSEAYLSVLMSRVEQILSSYALSGVIRDNGTSITAVVHTFDQYIQKMEITAFMPRELKAALVILMEERQQD